MINLKTKQRTLIQIGAGLLILVVGFGLGRRGSQSEVDPYAGHNHASETPAAEQKATVWTCSMHPNIKLPEFGLCPICNMDLIPLEDDGAEGAGLRELTVSDAAAKLMDIEVVPVERRFVTAQVRMVGKVAYDETRLATIAAWIPGRLDRLFVDYTGVPVRKGDHLVELYSPQLLTAQEELLQSLAAVKNTQESNLTFMRDTAQATVDAAREKLRLWGVTPPQIEQIESSGQVSDHMTIYAPMGGIVIHKNAMEGMYVKEGTPIYRIADLSQVWVKLDAYESDLQWLRYGQTVEFSAVSYPGKTFTGTVAFIDPALDPKTRTAKVRVNVTNTAGRLKPEMFVKALVQAEIDAGGRVRNTALAGRWICPMHPEIIKDEAGTCDLCEMNLVTTESLGFAGDTGAIEKPLVIPVSAALVTGTRAVVYVQKTDTEKPTFEGREIVLGSRAGDSYLVRSGLTEGELVVTRGNFKIDSALQILAKPSMMTPGGASSSSGHHHHGDSQSMKPTAMPGVEIGALSRHQMTQVINAANKVTSFLAEGNTDAVSAAFYGVQYSLTQVDTTVLTGEAIKQWQELSMRLQNDAVEGAEATNPQQQKKIADALSQNLSQLRQQFGLGSAHADHGTPALPEKLKQQLATLTQTYMTLQLSLANDNGHGAMSAASNMQKAIAAVNMSLFESESHNLWMNTLPILKEALAKIAATHDLITQREGFLPISQQMIGLSKTLGAVGANTLYVMHCPMAFDNRGGSWLQDNDKLLNPYFGATMLHCGTVEEVIPSR